MYLYCQSGVRKGEDFSPILFAIFINDLESSLNTEQCNSINIDDNILIDILIYACSSVVRAFADGAMVDPLSLFLVPASVTKTVVCANLSVV